MARSGSRNSGVLRTLWLLPFIGICIAFYLARNARGDDQLNVTDFSKGLITQYNPTSIDNGASTALMNVDVETGSLKKRGGSIVYSTSTLGGFGQPVRLLYEFITPTGTRWLISASSATIFKSDDGGQNNNVLDSTHGFTTSSQYCAITAYGTMRLTDGTTNWITFDGTNVGVSTNAPHGTTCAFFNQRIWTSTGSELRGSDMNNTDQWVANSTPSTTDTVFQPVRPQDGQGITCLKPFSDRLLVFKPQSLDAYVQNSDGITFILTPVSNNIGTTNCNSVVEREKDVTFLGPDGFYSYDPAGTNYKGYAGNVRRISDNIQPNIATIQQLDSNSIIHLETGQSDFNTGTLVQMTANASPGDLVLSTASKVDTSTTDFNAGSFNNTFATFTNPADPTTGRVYLSTDNVNMLNNSFESGSSNWSLGGATTVGATVPPFDGAACLQMRDNAGTHTTSYEVQDINGNVLTSGSVTPTGAWTQKTISLSGTVSVGRWIKIHIFDSGTGGVAGDTATSDPFIFSGTNITFYVIYDLIQPSPYVGFIGVDLFQGGKSDILSGSFTSSAFDTTFVTPVWTASSATFTTSMDSATFTTEASSDGTTWDSSVTWNTGSAPTSAFKRFLRYVVTLSTGGTTNGLASPYVDDVTLSAEASTGTYQGKSFSTTGVPLFGSFKVTEDQNGGATAYALYTATGSSSIIGTPSTWASSQTITSGQVPTIVPNNFAFFFASATVTNGSQTPTIHDLSLALVGGNQTPVWSDYNNFSYITALSTSSPANNDSILIYDKNNAYTFYDEKFYSLRSLLNNKMMGGGLDGNIWRFRDPTLKSDNGAAINVMWRSKDFDFGTPLADKTIQRYWATADLQTGSSIIFSYGKDRLATTPVTWDLGATPGFAYLTVKPSSLTFQRGKMHYFTISDNSATDTFTVRSVTMDARQETPP